MRYVFCGIHLHRRVEYLGWPGACGRASTARQGISARAQALKSCRVFKPPSVRRLLVVGSPPLAICSGLRCRGYVREALARENLRYSALIDAEDRSDLMLVHARRGS